MAVAILVAAGQGKRFGADLPKAFVELAGRPMLSWSLRALLQAPSVRRVALVVPRDLDLDDPLLSAALVGADAQASLKSGQLVLVHGGVERAHSVRNGLTALASASALPAHEPVAIHDAARPLVTTEIIEATISALGSADSGAPVAGAIAAAKVVDTIKRAAAGADPPAIEATVPREQLWAAQTPQVFPYAQLSEALDQSDEQLALATDEASIIERLGGKILLVQSGSANFKVTLPEDHDLAQLLLQQLTAKQ